MITSRSRRPVSPFFIPLSIASCTRSRPITGPAAPSSAITLRKATRRYWPCKYWPRRLRPVCLGGKELVSEQSLEVAIAAEQLERRAVHEHDRPVSHLHGREPLSRDEDGPAGDGRAQIVDEHPLGLGVDRRQRVVEHEDAGTRDQRPSERDALALSTGQIDAALADQRVVAVRQLVGELVDAGRSARGEHVVPGDVRPSGGEVVAQRNGEEDRTLRDDRHGGAQLGDRYVTGVDATDEDVPARRIVEAGQEVEQRRLAGAGR